MTKTPIIKIPKGSPWLDYSSLTLLQRCPRAYWWRHRQFVTDAVTGSALINGQAYHESKATYLQSIIDGKSHEEAKRLALEALGPIMFQIQVDDPKRNITVALDTMNYYFDYWVNSNYTPLQVEVGFAVDLGEFFFVGRIDSLEKCSFGEVVMETKTTTIVGERWQFRGDPNLQIDGYVAAQYIITGKMPFGGVLDVIPLHDKKRIEPFRFLAPRTEMSVETWLSEVTQWYNTLKRYDESGMFPRNTENCNPLVGYSCNFRILCKMFPNAHLMKEIPLPGEYKIEKWQPFEFEVQEVENESIK